MAVVWKCADETCRFTIHEGDLAEAPSCEWCDSPFMVKVAKTTDLDFGQAWAAMLDGKTTSFGENGGLFRIREYRGRLRLMFYSAGVGKWYVNGLAVNEYLVFGIDWRIVEEEKS